MIYHYLHPQKGTYGKDRRLLKALLKKKLKISQKECQLFKTELQYMVNVIFIKDRKVCVKPLRSRLEAIQKLHPPTTPKGCRSFVQMVNFLSMFCLELQKQLKPVYELTRKGRQFIWGEEQQNAFEEIKHRLIRPPILHMSDQNTSCIWCILHRVVTATTMHPVLSKQTTAK